MIHALYRWLQNLLENDKAPHNPDLSDDTFLKFIADSVDFPKIESPSENYKTAVEYFSIHASKRFFLASGKYEFASWSTDPDNILWRKTIVDTALRWREEGVPVYTTFTLPLGHSNFWNHLQGESPKDILFTVAPHRFYFAPVTSLASLLDPAALCALHDTVSNWISQMQSSNNTMGYLSDLTVAVRIASLCWSWHFLSSHKQNQSAARTHLMFNILKILCADINYLITLSPPKVKNNHRILYWFGIWFGSTLFPEFQPNTKITDNACDVMFREIMEQTYHDGGSYEHSLEYQSIICEVAAAALILCHRNGKHIPKSVHSRLHQMLRFYTKISGPKNVIPQIGDGTGLRLFSLSSTNDNIATGLQELLRTEFGECILGSNNSMTRSEWAYWILGGTTTPTSNTIDQNSFFQALDTGLYCMPDSELGVRLLFRTGPSPNSKVFAGHMHSDLLSIQADAHGHLILAAGGTFSYRTQPSGGQIDTPFNSSRSYFMGPLSHNCLCLGELDQLGPVENDFRPFDTTVRVVTTPYTGQHLNWIEAGITGETPYAGIQRGIIHVPGQYWLIYDRLPLKSAERSDNTVRFQCATQVSAKVINNGILFTHDDATTLSLNCASDQPAPILRSGESSPSGGWVSTRYGSMTAAPQVVWPLDPEQQLAIWLLTTQQHQVSSISACKISKDGLGFQIKHQQYTDTLLINPSGETIDWNEISMTGKCLWQRLNGEGVQEVRWLNSTGIIRTGSYTLTPIKPSGVAHKDNSAEQLTEQQ